MGETLNPDCTVLVNLSGGADSVFGLWRLLLGGLHRPLVHHCHLGGNPRLPWESKATKDALEWMAGQGLTNFEYVESHITLPPTKQATRMRDPDLIMMVTGQLLRDRPHIKRIEYFNNSQDTSTLYPRTRRRRVHIMQYWAKRKDIVIGRPLQHLTKAQIVRMMPTDLLDLCSWCRYPSTSGTPCRRCIPCRAIFAALQGET